MSKDYKLYKRNIADYIREANGTPTFKVASTETDELIPKDSPIWMFKNYPETYTAFSYQQQNQFDIFQKKFKDYGAGNLVGGLSKQEALLGLYFRMNDKLNRFKQLITTSAEVDESLEDTLDDLANYANITQIILQDKWGK